MNHQFLPSNYKAPTTSSYFKMPKPGEYRIRILSKPIFGDEEEYAPEQKSQRFRPIGQQDRPAHGLRPLRHFWSLVIWNYTERKIQIYHISQATIRNQIQTLSQDKEWGFPAFYDLKINKSGSDKQTKYVVTPVPAKPVTDEIKRAFYDTPCHLEAMFDGLNPFDANSPYEVTPGIFSEKDLKESDGAEKDNGLEELMEYLSIEEVDNSRLPQWIDFKASESKKTAKAVIDACRLKETLPKFKGMYQKWLATVPVDDEAIPF